MACSSLAPASASSASRTARPSTSCPVCLSPSCSILSRCSLCSSQFKVQGVEKKRKSRKLTPKQIIFHFSFFIFHFLSYLCTAIEDSSSLYWGHGAFRRDGRVVDYTGLENRRTERCRGFESLSFRKAIAKQRKESLNRLFFVLGSIWTQRISNALITSKSAGNHLTLSNSSFVSHFAASCSFKCSASVSSEQR